jgi:hypothetical protein
MSIVTQLLQIILRKRQPQDLEYSVTAAVVVVFGQFVMQAAIMSGAQQYSQPIAYGLVYTIANMVGVLLLLSIYKKQARFVQCISALLGVSLILQIMSIFAFSSGILAFTGVMIWFWNMYLLVLILRASLDCSLMTWILLTIAYHFFVGFAMIMVFPDLQTEIVSAWQLAAEQAQQQ